MRSISMAPRGENAPGMRRTFQADFDAPAEGFLVGVAAVIALGPLGVFDSADFLPKFDCVGAGSALACIAIDAVPFSVLQCDGEDVHDAVVECFAGGAGVHLG